MFSSKQCIDKNSVALSLCFFSRYTYYSLDYLHTELYLAKLYLAKLYLAKLSAYVQESRIMLTTIQFEAQNARVTKSLSQEGANSSLFMLYLAMQIQDPTLHSAIESPIFEDAHSYASINPHSPPKPNFYASEADYQLQNTLYSQVNGASSPSLYLALLNALAPQALNYLGEQEIVPEDVLANTSFETQQYLSAKNIHAFEQDNTDDIDVHSLNRFFDNVAQSRDYAF